MADFANKFFEPEMKVKTFYKTPATLVLEFQFTRNESPITLPWKAGGGHLPPTTGGQTLRPQLLNESHKLWSPQEATRESVHCNERPHITTKMCCK